MLGGSCPGGLDGTGGAVVCPVACGVACLVGGGGGSVGAGQYDAEKDGWYTEKEVGRSTGFVTRSERQTNYSLSTLFCTEYMYVLLYRRNALK